MAAAWPPAGRAQSSLDFAAGSRLLDAGGGGSQPPLRCASAAAGRCASARGQRAGDDSARAAPSRLPPAQGSLSARGRPLRSEDDGALDVFLGDIRRVATPFPVSERGPSPRGPSPFSRPGTVSRPASDCRFRRPQPSLLEASSYSARANSRADEFHQLCTESEGGSRPSESARPGRPGSADAELREAKARYEHINSAIEAAIAGDSRRVAPGEDTADMLGPGEQKWFLVQMPSYSAEVVVTLTREEGSGLSLYASFKTYPRPTPISHDMEAESDGRGGARLVHAHSHEGGSDGPALLHLCVAPAQAGARCSFRLHCSVRAQRRASDDDFDAEEHRKRTILNGSNPLHKNWFKEVMTTLHQDPAERMALEQRIRILQEKKKKGWRGLDKPIENKAEVGKLTPQARTERIKEAVMREAERRESVVKRREETEAELEKHREYLVNKSEIRKRQREEQVRALEEAQLLEVARADWLRRMVVVSYACRVCHYIHWHILEKRRMAKELWASELIQRYVQKVWLIKRLKRRRNNVIKFRIAAKAFCRQLCLADAQMAQTRASWFCATYVGQGEVKSFSLSVKTFLSQIRKVQECYRRTVRMRKARVEALLHHFLSESLLQVRHRFPNAANGAVGRRGPSLSSDKKSNTLNDLKKGKGAKKSSTAAKPKSTSAKRVSQVSPGKKSAANKRSTNTGKSVGGVGRRGSTNKLRVDSIFDDLEDDSPTEEVNSSDPPFVRDFKGEEPLPRIVRERVLLQHVIDMQLNYRDRLKVWQKTREGQREDEELAELGFAIKADFSSTKAAKPRTVELHRLWDLYSNTYDAFLRGEFQGLLAWRLRKLRMFFQAWMSVMPQQEQADLEEMGRSGSKATGTLDLGARASMGGRTVKNMRKASQEMREVRQLRQSLESRPSLEKRTSGVTRVLESLASF